jgi:hypothetical protein
MGIGKILTLVGAFAGILSIVLSFILPQYFGWFRIELESVSGVYITGLGTITSIPPGASGYGIINIVGGIGSILGAIICIYGSVKKMRAAAVIGGFLLLIGPFTLIMDALVISAADFIAIIQGLGGPSNINPLWGSFIISGPPDILLSWGLWIGFFIALAGGVIGLIGGILMK